MAGGNSSFWCAKWTKNQDTSVNHTELEASLPFPVRSRVGCSSAWLNGTYFDGKSGRELQFDEVSQPGKMCAGTGHQVNDGDHLLHQGQRKLLTHPQRCFKPADCVRWDQPRLAPRDGGAVWFPCSSLDNACFPMPQSPQLSHTPCQSWEGTRVTENLHHPKIRATGGKWPAPQALIDSKQKVLVAGGNHFIWPAEACRQLKKEFLYPVYILFGEGLIIRQEIYRRLSSNKVILIFLGGHSECRISIPQPGELVPHEVARQEVLLTKRLPGKSQWFEIIFQGRGWKKNHDMGNSTTSQTNKNL